MLANGQAQQAARPKATESGTESTPPKRRPRARAPGDGGNVREKLTPARGAPPPRGGGRPPPPHGKGEKVR